MEREQRLEAIGRVGLTVAIDGPAGSGKSTLSKLLADELSIGYLDTGAMYRSLTWFALERGVSLSDEPTVAALADEMPLRMVADPHDPHYWVGDVEVTSAIREPRISEQIMAVSTNLAVRRWMAVEQRRRMLEAAQAGSGMIAEGRDITTVVFPDANVRVLLLADSYARLERRTRELYGEVTPELLERTRMQIEERDRQDSTVSEFLTPADGVSVVDSSGLDIPGVVSAILSLVDADLERRVSAL